MNITPELLRRIAPVPRAKQAKQREITNAIAPFLSQLLPASCISGPWRLTNFLAQAAQETDGFSTLEEYASGGGYEGRSDLGNVQPGDGKRFKGRGIFQTTGRANYRTSGQRLSVDLIAQPERLLEPELAVKSAIDYWNSRNLSALADRNDLIGITKVINGGKNGLADRQRYAERIQKELFGGPLQALRRTNTGAGVRWLQTELNRINYFAGEIDGNFGPRTDDAVRAFQRDYDLTIDGIAGPATWAKLCHGAALGVTRRVNYSRAHTTLGDLASGGSRIAASSVKGTWATLSAVAGTVPLILAEASNAYRTQAQPLRELLAPFGGLDRIALGLLVAVSVFSAVQHIRAGRARTEDHQTGRTL